MPEFTLSGLAGAAALARTGTPELDPDHAWPVVAEEVPGLRGRAALHGDPKCRLVPATNDLVCAAVRIGDLDTVTLANPYTDRRTRLCSCEVTGAGAGLDYLRANGHLAAYLAAASRLKREMWHPQDWIPVADTTLLLESWSTHRPDPFQVDPVVLEATRVAMAALADDHAQWRTEMLAGPAVVGGFATRAAAGLLYATIEPRGQDTLRRIEPLRALASEYGIACPMLGTPRDVTDQHRFFREWAGLSGRAELPDPGEPVLLDALAQVKVAARRLLAAPDRWLLYALPKLDADVATWVPNQRDALGHVLARYGIVGRVPRAATGPPEELAVLRAPAALAVAVVLAQPNAAFDLGPAEPGDGLEHVQVALRLKAEQSGTARTGLPELMGVARGVLAPATA